nr:MAG TPA: hypothetical protein [Caudoviricetes sp.]
MYLTFIPPSSLSHFSIRLATLVGALLFMVPLY